MIVISRDRGELLSKVAKSGLPQLAYSNRIFERIVRITCTICHAVANVEPRMLRLHDRFAHQLFRYDLAKLEDNTTERTYCSVAHQEGRPRHCLIRLLLSIFPRLD